MKKSAEFWIKSLQLLEHPEGGYFRESYRSSDNIPDKYLPDRYSTDESHEKNGSHSFSTCIYYLLKKNQFSALHRLKSDEIWHYYAGDPVQLHIIETDGDGNSNLLKPLLGPDWENKESFQIAVKSGSWFGGMVVPTGSYCLLGCTVAPGFEFSDFDLADRRDLLAMFPDYRDVIIRLTKENQ